jgi:hypothetical protein
MRANVGFDLECDAFDGDWQRVSGTTPCPVCGGLEDCRTHVEEAFACCLRRPSDWRLDNGGWLHRITAAPALRAPVVAAAGLARIAGERRLAEAPSGVAS